MDVNITAATGGGTAPALPAPRPQSLSKDQFLQLLMLQLQNQDPLQPLQDDQMVAQLAQFAALEQMNNIGSMSALAAAVQLLGHQVSAFDPASGLPVSGAVSLVRQAGDQVLVRIGDQAEVPVQAVLQVNQP